MPESEEKVPAKKQRRAAKRLRAGGDKRKSSAEALAKAVHHMRAHAQVENGMLRISGRKRADQPKESLEELVAKLGSATPLQLVDVEREGVRGRLLKDLAHQMAIPKKRLYQIIGVPRATGEKKASGNKLIAGSGGQAALGMVRLLGIARSIVENSTAKEAIGFDAAQWLGQWIERPQPSLGGRRPADLLDTPTGVDLVARLLGALESGAYL